MPKVDFSDAAEKLKRANQHIAEAETFIANYLTSDFYRVRFENDHVARRTKILFDSLHPPSKAVNLAIGDAISNLRSTLDYLVVAMLSPITGTTKHIEFPFADDKSGFEGTVNKGVIKGTGTAKFVFSSVGSAVVTLLIDQVQAYKGGRGHSLWVLNKLRNIDKHRLLVAATRIAGVRASWVAGRCVYTDCSMGITAGQNGTFIDADLGTVKFTAQPQLTFTVCINEPEADAIDLEAIEFLKHASGQVNSLLQTLDVLV
jgi:hypothetical protein